MSPQLTLSTLGDLSIQLGGEPITDFPTRKVKALLVYLAVEKAKIHRRESLFTLLWPEMPEKSARNNLRQVLYYLRKTIPRVASYSGDNQIPLLISDHYTVQINPNADLSVDLHCIDQLLEEIQSHGHYSLADCEPCLQKLERVISLYHGEFLVDFYLDNSSLFENWAVAICEAYRRNILEAMAILVDIYLQNADYVLAKNLAEQQLEINPLSENSYRQLMEALARDGHRVKALRQYQICQRTLKNELDISPSQETMQVYERIRAEKLGVPCLQPKNIDSRRFTPRHNLTSQATPFIGRQHNLEQLDEWLKEPNIRLISIVGLGGIGKTRLAIACAERQLLPEGQDQRLR
ncbi:MAG: BTAD domain-containing putative transcriptional regulator, partial [Anaerolineales bacterium]